jgi:hypothetical protein
MRITIDDARQAGHCVSGVRAWARSHPHLDFRDFLKNGVDSDDLPQDDALVQQIIERKVQRELLDVDPAEINGLTITAEDVQAAGKCLDGSREWARLNGFDFRDFIKNGVPAAQLLATGDAEARLIVRHALERNRNGRR